MKAKNHVASMRERSVAVNQQVKDLARERDEAVDALEKVRLLLVHGGGGWGRGASALRLCGHKYV